jgi:hypothetical protein
MRLEQRTHGFALPEFGVSDDSGHDGRAVDCVPPFAFFRNCLDKLGLAGRTQVFRPAIPVMRPALDEDRLGDIVPGRGVAQQFVEQVVGIGVVVVRAVPQVMVWIADWQTGVDRLFPCQGKPVFAFASHASSAPDIRHTPSGRATTGRLPARRR